MADEMKVTIKKREAIKPSYRTPEHLRTVKLSMIDQVHPDMYVPLIFFYPFSTNTNNPVEIAYERLQLLKESLSKVLTLYYPFAGRLSDNLEIIDSNDEGAEFIEAKASVTMSEILRNPDPDSLTNLIAALPGSSSLESHGGCVLLVQATIFECGGIALGLSFSHKLADACTIGGFVKSWAKITATENTDQLLTTPEFGLACDIFPPIPVSSPYEAPRSSKCVTKRYVFTPEKIAALKRHIAETDDDHVISPTRVEAVSSLLWKCVATKSLAFSTLSHWFQVMNLRKRFVPPFGDHVAGNVVSGYMVKTTDGHHSLGVLVDKLRKGIAESAESYSKKGDILGTYTGLLQEIECAKKSINGCYSNSSWCRFGLYEADFGWEKPTWVSLVSFKYTKTFVLLDTKDGVGIEAWLFLSEEDMAFIETDQEFLAFASLNPSVV